MNLSDAIDQFVLLRRHKLQAGTVRQDEGELRTFLAFVGNIRVQALTAEHLEDYFYGPKGRVNQVQESTFNTVRGRIINFTRWLADEGLVKQNLMRRVDRRKIPQSLRQRLTAEQMLEALELAKYPRDRVAIAIGCNTGMRISSIAKLKVEDLDLDAGFLAYWNVKARRQLEMPITMDLDRELRRWLIFYATECGPLLDPKAKHRYGLQEDWFLVPARYRFGLVRDELGRIMQHPDGGGFSLKPTAQLTKGSRIVHAVLEPMGLDRKGEGFHTFRRSSARVVYEQALKAGDPRAIHIAQAYLDHTDASVTQKYIGTNFEKQKLEEIMRGKSFLSPPPAEAENVISLADRRKNKGTAGG